MTSISDYQATFCGKDFILCATQEALAAAELELGVSYADVLVRMSVRTPRLTDVTAMFAALATPHGKYNGKTIRAIMPFDDGSSLKACSDHVRAAIEKALPQAKPDEENDGGKGENPQ